MKERIFIKRANEQVKLEEWLRSQLHDVRVGQIELGQTPLGLRVIIHTASPGLVIGPGGEKIRELSQQMKEKFSIENPQIDVQKIDIPDLDPMIVAQSIAFSMERNGNPKKVGKFFLEKIMRAGAIGCEIIIGGKLSGEKARRERFIAGYLKKCGEPAKQDVIKGYAVATPKLGNIGVRISIMVRHSDKKVHVPKPDPSAVGEQDGQPEQGVSAADAEPAKGAKKKTRRAKKEKAVAEGETEKPVEKPAEAAAENPAEAAQASAEAKVE
jgi:small subunit ribosomal protein S3